MRCRVCGNELNLTKESHYVARTEDETGQVKVLSNCESTLYDAFDCPTCGCQNLVGERHRPYEWNGTLPTEIYEDEEETHGMEVIDFGESGKDSTVISTLTPKWENSNYCEEECNNT